MPPKGSGAAAVAAASVNWKVDVQGIPIKFTSFSPIGLLNGKNVAANFVKTESQSSLTQRTTDEDYVREREKKRRRLMAIDHPVRAPRHGEHAQSDSDGECGSESDDNVTAPPDVDVLQLAPKGMVQRPKPVKSLVRCRLFSTGRIVRLLNELEQNAQDPGLESEPLARIIVIHPGSSYLRIGRASDAFPLTVPNVIARRTRPGTTPRKPHRPSVVPTFDSIKSPSNRPSNSNDDDDEDEVDELDEGAAATDADALDPLSAKIASVRTTLRARMRAYKLRGQGSGNRQASDYNQTVKPEKTDDFNDPDEIEWTDVGQEDVFVGEKALRIADPDAAGFVLRRPFDRGQFNTNGYVSSQELLSDIETIWLKTLEDELQIKRSELKDYSCILLIPDLYDQVYVREMTELILHAIGFKQVILQQESVCATFGAGISTACVVDIGSKVTTITCVEEGLASPESRLVLDFGGDDITAFLYTLLVRLNFPYRDADLSRWYDWKVLEDLKERMVVLGEGDVGLNLYDFFVRTPGKPTRKYSMRSYDESILAPYALFAPRVIDFDNKVQPQTPLWAKGVDDNVDIGSQAITQAMKNSTRHLRHAAPMAVAATVPKEDGGEGTMESPLCVDASQLPLHAASPNGTETSAAAAPAPPPPATSLVLKTKEPKIDPRLESGKIPLDVAIVESILATGAEDRIKKLSNNVLLCGGTSMIHNIGFAVESRIAGQLVRVMPSLAGQVVVVPPPQEIDPKIMSWKGVAMLGKLECANEMWVRQDEWERAGMRAVRERLFYFA
ncbi:BQ5605_C024g09919 [Microbotryum silenes-dioicae]|uniref:BQ5605_C024g09919 protein n=1 Tax=Microbotryum silenes-dioicae TaxID=796604 RepID=A0A2X0NEV9_9BASI|nr:BQ5605_C024g09919 [Microbotryum silenes-dioicae]